VLVGGRAAELRDLLSSLSETLPWMALFVVGTYPGAPVPRVRVGGAADQGRRDERAVAVGVLRRAGLDLPGRAPDVCWASPATGFIEATQPILMLAMAFGLSMDYEVFLLSRVREQWDRTGDNTTLRRDRAAAHREDHHQRRRSC
jgi:RND superfamily putative drug exporter